MASSRSPLRLTRHAGGPGLGRRTDDLQPRARVKADGNDEKNQDDQHRPLAWTQILGLRHLAAGNRPEEGLAIDCQKGTGGDRQTEQGRHSCAGMALQGRQDQHEFAGEAAGTRHADTGQAADQEAAGEQGHGLGGTAQAVDVGRAGALAQEFEQQEGATGRDRKTEQQ